MKMIFIKNFEEFGHVFGKLLIFLFILIKYCAYPWFGWPCRASYWLYIKVSKNRPCLGRKRVIDQQYFMRFGPCEMLEENDITTWTTCTMFHIQFDTIFNIHTALQNTIAYLSWCVCSKYLGSALDSLHIFKQ